MSPPAQLHRHKLARAVAAAVLCAACGDETFTAPRGPNTASIGVALTLSTQQIYPGEAVAFYLDIDPPEGQAATRAMIWVRGPFTDSLELPVPGPGPLRYTITLQTDNGPLLGTFEVMAVGWIQSVSDTARGSFRVVDDGLPRIKDFFVHVGPEPGDTMQVAIIAEDYAGIPRVDWRFRGAVSAAGTLDFDLPDEIARTVKVAIPVGARLGDSIFVDVTIRDVFGNVTSATLATRVWDLHVPVITAATLSAGRYDSLSWRPPTYFTGDTMIITLAAHDRRLAWAGWRLKTYHTPADFADSTALADTSVALTFKVPVTPAMDGSDRHLVFFVRDSSGNETVREHPAVFVDGARRTFQTLPFSLQWSAPGGYAWVPSRGMIVAQAQGQTVAISAQPFRRVGPAIGGGALMAMVAGDTLAWTVGYDSLRAIRVTADGLSLVRSIHVAAPFAVSGFAVLSGNRAFVSGVWPFPGILIVDLATGSYASRSAAFPRMTVASADGSLVIGYDSDGNVMAYDALTDSFGPPVTAAVGIPTINGDGSLVLIRNSLYDRQLRFLRKVGPAEYDEKHAVISADGAYAYFYRWPGYHKVRISDGTVVEKVFVPDFTHYMLELPEREQMFFLGQLASVLMDLGPAGIAPAR